MSNDRHHEISNSASQNLEFLNSNTMTNSVSLLAHRPEKLYVTQYDNLDIRHTYTSEEIRNISKENAFMQARIRTLEREIDRLKIFRDQHTPLELEVMSLKYDVAVIKVENTKLEQKNEQLERNISHLEKRNQEQEFQIYYLNNLLKQQHDERNHAILESRLYITQSRAEASEAYLEAQNEKMVQEFEMSAAQKSSPSEEEESQEEERNIKSVKRLVNRVEGENHNGLHVRYDRYDYNEGNFVSNYGVIRGGIKEMRRGEIIKSLAATMTMKNILNEEIR